MPTNDMYYVWDIEMRERLARVEEKVDLKAEIARLQEKNIASEKALELARGSLSRNNVIAVITIIIAIIAVAVSILKH